MNDFFRFLVFHRKYCVCIFKKCKSSEVENDWAQHNEKQSMGLVEVQKGTKRDSR